MRLFIHTYVTNIKHICTTSRLYTLSTNTKLQVICPNFDDETEIGVFFEIKSVMRELAKLPHYNLTLLSVDT